MQSMSRSHETEQESTDSLLIMSDNMNRADCHEPMNSNPHFGRYCSRMGHVDLELPHVLGGDPILLTNHVQCRPSS
jgi:hypothetical protein